MYHILLLLLTVTMKAPLITASTASFMDFVTVAQENMVTVSKEQEVHKPVSGYEYALPILILIITLHAS